MTIPIESGPATRAKQKQMTRVALLEATIDIIADEGISGFTLAKVAERTGLSQGICNFHFRSKEQLMLDAFRMLYQEHGRAWRAAISNVKSTPTVRLTCLIEALLRPPIADHRKLSVWLAFWGVAPHRQTYLDICSAGDREYEEAVEGILRELSPGTDMINGMSLSAIAIALTGMIDGAHLQYLIAPGRLEPEEAIRACLAYLTSFFPEFKSLLLRRD